MRNSEKIDLLSHHPKSIKSDALAFRDYARTIHKILTELTAENTGLTVGIFGDWGSGKSTVLKMVDEMLASPSMSLKDRGKQFFRGCRGIWYRSVSRNSRKGELLQLYRTLPQKADKSEQKYYHPLIVRFDAWEYSQEQVWVAFLREIDRAIDENLKLWWPYIRLQLWVHRIQWVPVITQTIAHLIGRFLRVMLFFLLLFGVVEVLRQISDSSGWLIQSINQLIESLDIAATVKLLIPLAQGAQGQVNWFNQLISWLKDALGKSSEAAAVWILFSWLFQHLWRGVKWIFLVKPKLPPGFIRPTLDKKIPLVVEQFREELLDLVKVVGHKKPIVVLIDDLDRAPTNQIVPVLEAIKHFGVESDVKTQKQLKKQRAPIAFVLAVDHELIQRAIASYYKDFWATMDGPEANDFAREYLEKIIQVPFELPPLSSSHLNNLFERSSTVTTENTSAALSLTLAREEAQEVFVHGPKENPRQVIQAYNTFQTLWQIVQQRRLERIEPKVLAVLILIKYVWHHVFELFFRYPELFFDLHALATETPNKICSTTEIEELLSLGCPTVEPAPMIETIRQKHPQLLHLLRNLLSLRQLDTKQFLLYLTLIEDQQTRTNIHPIEGSTALLSGDPSLIKFVVRTNAKVKGERLPWLIEFLEFKNSVTETEPSTENLQQNNKANKVFSEPGPDKREKMIKALFALGRVKDGQAIEPIKQIVSRRNNYGEAIIIRAIFAIAHLLDYLYVEERQQEFQKKDQVGQVSRDVQLRKNQVEMARRLLAEVLEAKDTSPPLKLRILRLLGPTVSSDSEARHPIVRIALRDEMEFVRNKAFEITKQMNWLRDAFHELESGSKTEVAYDGYFRLIESLSKISDDEFPEQVKDHLLGLAADHNSPYQVRAFQSLANFPNPEKSINFMANLIAGTEDNHILEMAIKRLGEQQAVSDVKWQANVWEKVEQVIENGPLQLLSFFVQALGKTFRVQAISHLERIWQNHFDMRMRKEAEGQLQSMANFTADDDDIESKKAIHQAQIVLQKYNDEI